MSLNNPGFSIRSVMTSVTKPAKALTRESPGNVECVEPVFYTQYSSLLHNIIHYRDEIKGLQTLHIKALTAANETQQRQIQKAVASLEKSLRAQQEQIAVSLELLKAQTDRTDPDQVCQINNLNRNFEKAIKELIRAQLTYKDDLLNQAVDQYRVVNPEASKDEALEFVERCDTSQVLFKCLNESKLNIASGIYKNVSARWNEVQKVERSAGELNSLMLTIHDLVLEQDAGFDSVLEKVEGSRMDLERGDVAVEGAIEQAQRRNKWAKVGIVIGLVALMVLAIVLLGLAKYMRIF